MRLHHSFAYLLFAISAHGAHSFSIFSPFGDNNSQSESALEAHANAIKLATTDKLTESVPFFEKAQRLEPQNVDYMNDLAVTYLRLNKLEEAKDLLDKAKLLMPDHEQVKENLQAVEEHLRHRDQQLKSRAVPAESLGSKTEQPDMEEPYRPGMYGDPYASPKPKQKKRKISPPRVDFHEEHGSAVPSYDDVLPKTAPEYIREGINLAMEGDLKGALPLMEKASALEPRNVGYMNDLGVTYLRLNMLEECERVLNLAISIEPDNQSILDNRKALQEHLDFRQKQTEDREAEVFAESVLEAPFRSDSVRDVQVDPAYAKAGAYDDSGSSEATSWFGPWYYNSTLKAEIATKLKANKPVIIRNVFREDYAEKLYEELDNSPHFRPYEGYEEWYQFTLNAIYMNEENSSPSIHPVLNDVYSFVDSPAVKSWVKDVTGSDASSKVAAGAAHYKAGDYTMPHTDFSDDGTKTMTRRVAFVVHMTKDWDDSLGGDLIFMDPTYHIHPTFNTMTLFSVTVDSWHFVSPVAKHCPEDMKRLSFSGWWMSSNQDEIVAKYSNDLSAQSRKDFMLMVDGSTSQILPYKPLS